uniref:Uncharacterized protein n=1 Tax=Photinus pyralis TaxID=7054 RepID=A0A1Y1M9J0_PHOPY
MRRRPHRHPAVNLGRVGTYREALITVFLPGKWSNGAPDSFVAKAYNFSSIVLANVSSDSEVVDKLQDATCGLVTEIKIEETVFFAGGHKVAHNIVVPGKKSRQRDGFQICLFGRFNGPHV